MGLAEVDVTVDVGSGAAYVALFCGGAATPEVRESVALGALEEAGAIPALDSLVLDFDHYGRLAGIRVEGSADSVLSPSLLEAATSGATT
jgi:hypothetical protein